MNNKIKLEKVSIYRDGGTSKWIEPSVKESLKTVEEAKIAAYYFVDNRVYSTTKGELFDRYPSNEGAILLNKNNFEFL